MKLFGHDDGYLISFAYDVLFTFGFIGAFASIVIWIISKDLSH